MKRLNFAEEVFEAQRIAKTDNSVIGYNGIEVVFAFLNVSDFTKFILEAGQEFDIEVNEIEQMRIEIARGNAEMFETMLTLVGGR